LFHRVGEYGVQLAQAFSERGWARLKNVRRLNFVDVIIAYRTDVLPSVTPANQILLYLATAPRTDDDLRIATDHVCRIDDPVLRGLVLT